MIQKRASRPWFPKQTRKRRPCDPVHPEPRKASFLVSEYLVLDSPKEQSLLLCSAVSIWRIVTGCQPLFETYYGFSLSQIPGFEKTHFCKILPSPARDSLPSPGSPGCRIIPAAPPAGREIPRSETFFQKGLTMSIRFWYSNQCPFG